MIIGWYYDEENKPHACKIHCPLNVNVVSSKIRLCDNRVIVTQCGYDLFYPSRKVYWDTITL